MAGYNRIIMIGNLTRDPEYKQLPSGQGVCQLGLASNRQYRNKQTGSMVQEVCFVDIDVFGPQAESCNQYLQKVRSVLVEGRLKVDTWETAEGQKRSKHTIVADRVVFLSSSVADEDGVQRTTSPSTNISKEASELEKEFFGAQTPQKEKKEPAQKKPAAPAEKSVPEAEQPSVEAKDAGEVAFKDEPPFADDLPF